MESVPVSPGSSLTHQTSTCSLPLPKHGTVVAELLFQHAVVPEVLLAASSREGLHKLLLKQNQVEFMGTEELGAKETQCFVIALFMIIFTWKRILLSPLSRSLL